MDWTCQLKLSILIGIVAALGNHTLMDHVFHFPIEWGFDLLIFLGATLAFMVAMKMKWIKCRPFDNPTCDVCREKYGIPPCKSK